MNVPPPEHHTEAFYRYLEKRYPKHEQKKWVEADDAILANVKGWRAIDDQIDELKRQRHAAKNQICARIGDAEGVRGGTGDDAWRLPWRGVKGPTTLDHRLLETTLRHLLGDAETDRIVKTCSKTGSGYRKLGPYWEPKKKTTALESVTERMRADLAKDAPSAEGMTND